MEAGGRAAPCCTSARARCSSAAGEGVLEVSGIGVVDAAQSREVLGSDRTSARFEVSAGA